MFKLIFLLAAIFLVEASDKCGFKKRFLFDTFNCDGDSKKKICSYLDACGKTLGFLVCGTITDKLYMYPIIAIPEHRFGSFRVSRQVRQSNGITSIRTVVHCQVICERISNGSRPYTFLNMSLRCQIEQRTYNGSMTAVFGYGFVNVGIALVAFRNTSGGLHMYRTDTDVIL